MPDTVQPAPSAQPPVPPIPPVPSVDPGQASPTPTTPAPTAAPGAQPAQATAGQMTAGQTTSGQSGQTDGAGQTAQAGKTGQTTTPPKDISLLSTIHWDFTAIVLVLCSVLVVATIIERAIRLWKASIDAGKFMDRIRNLLRGGQYPEAVKFADASEGSVAKVVKAAILSRDRSMDEIKDAVERVRVRQGAYLERNLPILGTIGATAPFIGLFGTVLGIWRAFQDIGQAGSAGTSVVATGIAGALQATAGGLLVAIMSVIAYNFFINWSGRIMLEVETAGNEIVHLLANDGSGAPGR